MTTMTQPTTTPQTLINALHWRYATKAFDASKKLTTEQWNTLEQALILTASSFGLQPWKFINVTDANLRTQLKASSWNQGQVTDASHLVVIAAKTKIETKDVEEYVNYIAQTRGIALTGTRGAAEVGLEQFKGMVIQSLPMMTKEWAARQCYIALGNLLTSAALLGVDACPMEGFDAAAYDKALGLTEMGYSAVVICPLGYRSAEDKYAHMKKVRYPASQMVVKK